MKKIARERVREFIKTKVGNKIFGVEFIKKDGSRRKMIARIGVKNHLKGGRNNVERIDRPYMTVFDMQKKEYRTFNPRTAVSLKVDGESYEII